MNGIATNHDDRADVVQETASRLGFTPAIIEKDFWVCWSLQKLFVSDERLPSLLFKGGTSLSKVFKVIQRFSEDIDISLDRHDLGFKDERDPTNASSNKRPLNLSMN